MSTGLCGPYRLSRTTPATIVGSANGMSMMTSTNRLPGKSSRTSTQAIRVPMTALTNATPSELSRVRDQRATAWCLVISSTKPDQPLPMGWPTIAASGNRTSRDS